MPPKAKPRAKGATKKDEKAASPQIFCVKCKERTDTEEVEQTEMKNGRPATRGKCAVCGTGKYRIGTMQ